MLTIFCQQKFLEAASRVGIKLQIKIACETNRVVAVPLTEIIRRDGVAEAVLKTAK